MKKTILAIISAIAAISAQATPPTRDVTFAEVDGKELKMNIFLPKDKPNPPLVVYIHGGGWVAKSYKDCLVEWLADSGYAVASVGYRLSQTAKWPAQIHDCKAAVRWLRAHQADYGYDTSRIAVCGASAGGYLALMVGVTGDEKELEGTVGGNLDESSKVDAIVDYYGASDFVLRSKSQPKNTETPGHSTHALLGVSCLENPDLAKRSSPAFYVKQDSPPLLMLHGDKDTTVLMDQSERMLQVYNDTGIEASLIVVPGAGHAEKSIYAPEYRKQVVAFLDSHFKKQPTQ